MLNLALISPLLAFAMAEAFDLPPELAVGLVLLGASPGGMSANILTHLARGDTALSVTMTATPSIRCHPEEVRKKRAATSHRLGFAVKVLGDGGLPSHDARRWSSGPHLRHSLERLRAILDHLERHDIRMYRLPTALAPYASHPDLTQFHGQVEECADELAEVGALARERDVRLSSHPGQYTVLNSERPEVRDAAVAELEVQALATWADGTTPKIHYSSPRLDVETRRVRTGRRVERRLVLPQLRAHADLIDPIGFEQFLLDAPDGRDFDVMLEAKAKDVALLRLRDQLAERGFPSEHGRLRVAVAAR